MNHPDERQGKPSASYIERIALCPGSWNLEKTLPNPPDTDDASRGTRIHDALAGIGSDVLTAEEQEVAEKCRRLKGESLEAVFGMVTPDQEFRERRFWLPTNSFSGKADYIAIHDNKALILDYKTGRADVEEAKGNLQLRALAVLLWLNDGMIDSVTVGIIQPFASPQLSLCEYSTEELGKANVELHDILAKANHSEAPRIPGEKQCKYCKAKAVCPQAIGLTLGVAKDGSAMMEKPTQEQVAAVVAAMPADNLANLLDRCRVAEMVIEAAKDNAKSRIQAGEDIPGYRLKDGSTRTTITNPAKVFDRFNQQGGSVSDFLACITVKSGTLKASFKALTGAKGKGLDLEYAALIEGCSETKETAPQLERVKE